MTRIFTWVFGFFAIVFAQTTFAQTYTFEWNGASGYSMRGAMLLSRQAPSEGIVTGNDVTCFEIYGFQDGQQIGSWNLKNRTNDTTWRLHFDAGRHAFLAIGDGIGMPQAWNMDGAGRNCGADGFGFNLGSFAQDICLDNTLIVASQVPPPTPLPATPVLSYDFADETCNSDLLLSLLD